MLRFLQNYPHAMELIYDFTHRLILPFKPWLRPDSRLEPWFTRVEEIGKRAVFNCQMCGQCILHSTGMTCPMNCPKNLRNGPCGGVRANGHCEVKPEIDCVWVQAFERSQQMPAYGHELIQIQPPVNRQLEGSSSWINMLHGIDTKLPDGWVSVASISTPKHG
ncbi:MAG: hypothetical protein DHS20C20_23080 [Ardenticatenaceae bacterium]|nr:MAG: hypothetical protein DHS20C20_23080 [Ardenticatenaceae bacterium]